ncbi:MAG: hypothetical protein ACXABY_12280 [Candidatus Thorarchaeota archaeon]|jgi:hypothetical protein
MSGADCKIIVAHYDERGDPAPPNNYRPELKIGDDYLFTRVGCVSKAIATAVAEQWSAKTGIVFDQK